MSSRFASRPPSLWSRTSPNMRLVFGAFAIAAIGVFGLTPKTMPIFDWSIAWPYAALWGAVGWGRAPLAIRPLALLIIFGLVQDISFNAPLGSFVIVNLSVYGLCTWVSGILDVTNEAALAALVAVGAIAAGFTALWVLASLFADHPVRVLPLLKAFFTTVLGYALLAPVFDLGIGRGEGRGQMA